MRSAVQRSLKALALTATLALGAPAALAAQQEVPAGVAALLDAAAAEGEVLLFVSTDARTAEHEAQLEKGLLEDLGIAIDIKLVSGAPDPVYIQQLIQQHNAGVPPQVDLLVTVPTLLTSLVKANAVAATDWSALDVDPDDLAGDVHGLFVAEFARPVIYNTNLLKPDEAPASLEELLDPKWTGKIVTAGLPDVFSPWAIGLGADRTLELVETLFVDLKVGVAPAPTAIRTLVESGEYPIGFGIRISGEQIKNGSPVAYAPIKAPVVPRYAALLEGSQHRNAATLVGWWLSTTANGQRLAADVLDWPRHTTEGTDLYEMTKRTGGVYVEGADWWMHESGPIGARIARLLQDL